MVLKLAGQVSESPLRLRDVPAPKAGGGQIRVKVRACGLCHTGLHTVKGELALPKRTHTEVFLLEQANKVLRILKDSQIKAAAVLQVAD